MVNRTQFCGTICKSKSKISTFATFLGFALFLNVHFSLNQSKFEHGKLMISKPHHEGFEGFE